MKKKFIIAKRILAVSILTICVSVSLSNYSFGIGYYGTHHSGHHGGHHSNFGHHGGHHGSFGHHSGHHGNFRYYGVHHSGHHSSFGHHGGHHSSSLHNHRSNRLHSSLYNHRVNGLHGQHYVYRTNSRYGYYNHCAQDSGFFADERTEDTYEYVHKEPYVFVYGNEYNPSSNTYVHQYEQGDKKESNLVVYNNTN